MRIGFIDYLNEIPERAVARSGKSLMELMVIINCEAGTRSSGHGSSTSGLFLKIVSNPHNDVVGCIVHG